MFSNKKKKLTYLKNQWGKKIDRFRNIDLISIYHNNIISKDSEDFVDDRTWNDLDFDTIFSKMDRNVSSIGQQYLYHILHKYENDEAILKERYSLIQYLRKSSSLRESLQLLLSSLTNTKAYFIPSLIISNIPPRSKYYYLLIILSILMFISSSIIYFIPYFLLITLGFLTINIILSNILSSKIYDYFAGFSSLRTLLIIASKTCKVKSEIPIKELNYLRNKKRLINKLSKKLGKFVIDKEGLNDFVRAAIEYLNLFFLYDLIAYYKSVNILNKYQKEIRGIYESLASLDTYISIASYVEEHNTITTPVFNDCGKIGFDNISHPLLENAVPNTIADLSRSVLITGSNMSGKTTFIKTVGINIILAQTLYFCHADKFETHQFKVKSAIKREENLKESKSYFFVEIEELQSFIKLAQRNKNYLFLIDEIFRGTNTIERLAISTSVLEFLNQHGKVLVTTHDIELQDLLEDSYAMYHFGDQVNDGKYYFNYKIQKGPCLSGNAIKLLEIKGYPKSITEKAKILANELNPIKIIKNDRMET
jgi:DNA mismatch repair ATPase MutS